MKQIKVNKYVSEVDNLEQQFQTGFNLLVSSTGSGKSKFALDLADKYPTGVLAPYVCIVKQLANDTLTIKKGMKERQAVSTDKSVVATFKSAVRLLEQSQMEYLVIDELHTLVNYASFTKGMISNMWNVVLKLQKKFPKLKIICLTATPHFVKMFNFNFQTELFIKPKQILSKPEQIIVVNSTKDLLATEQNYIYLYPSKKMGKAQANKYAGEYIDATNKETLPVYSEILEGRTLSEEKIFTSTCMATGVSIVSNEINTVITNWNDLIDLAQFAARLRKGCRTLFVGVNIPWIVHKFGVERPVEIDDVINNALPVKDGEDFEKVIRIIQKYQLWFSVQSHLNDKTILQQILTMLVHNPTTEINEDWL